MAQSELPADLEDITAVGPDKPMGYLPADTIEEVATIGDCRRYAETHQLDLWIGSSRLDMYDLTPENRALAAVTSVDYLCLFDRDALGQLLGRNAQLLQANDWPVDPELFVEKVISEPYVEDDSPVSPVIHQAFGEHE